jgi:hypothetical protein
MPNAAAPNAAPSPARTAVPAHLDGGSPAAYPQSGSPAAGETDGRQPPSSWADSLWGEPVEPQRTPRPAPGPVLTQARPAHGTEDAGSRRPANGSAARDLLPPTGTAEAGRADGPAGLPGPDPAGARPQPRGAARAPVSIGTIEVTVVPPAQPEATRSAPPTATGRSRPASLLASGSGADRLRDGLRRWHGTAQG